MNNLRVTQTLSRQDTVSGVAFRLCWGRLMARFALFVLALVVMLAGATTLALAATYYLDAVNGNDANNGSAGAPFKSLAKAQSVAVAEDTVILKTGNYGQFTENVNRNGWITYKADTNAAPVLTGIRTGDYEFPVTYAYLIFDGLVIQGTISFPYTDYIQVKNCVITGVAAPYHGVYEPYYYPNTYGIHGRESSHIVIENNWITNGYRGISATGSCNDWIIKNNHIHYLGEDGINVTISNLIIDGNTIYDLVSQRTTIDLYATKTGEFIEGEEVVQAGTNAKGIAYKWQASSGGYLPVWQATGTAFTKEGGIVTGQQSKATLTFILTNPAHKVDPTHRDAIHIESSTVNNIRISDNIVKDVDLQGISLYGHGGLSNAAIFNNLIYGANNGKAIVISGVNGVDIYNNTAIGAYVRLECTSAHPFISIVNNLYNNIFSDLRIESDAGAGYIQILNHGNNIFGNNPSNGTSSKYPFTVASSERANYNLNSLFMNSAENDFRLSADSQAINFGSSAHTSPADIRELARDTQPDAGCYEYSPSMQISQYGITWTFDKEYEYGQFANGDYWVVGPVNIIGINPLPVSSVSAGRNGTMLNPRFAYSQGYDSRAPKYNADLCKTPPFILQPGDTIISSISLETRTSGFTFLKTAAVLTVVDTPQTQDKFRPPYTRANRVAISANDPLSFSTNNIKWGLLSQIHFPSAYSLTATARKFQRVWIEHFKGWELGRIQPAENMPDYGRENARDVSEAALQLLLDYSKDEKTKLMIGFLQYGIDLYGIYLDGGEWHPDGGIFCGRKWPLLFTGIMMDNEIKNIPMPPERFQEDAQTFYIGNQEIYATPYKPSVTSDFQTGTSGYAKLTQGSDIVEGVNTSWGSGQNIGGSVVIGTDGKYYVCIVSHTSGDSSSDIAKKDTTQPVTGTNWQTYWKQTDYGLRSQAWNYLTSYKKGHWFGIPDDCEIFKTDGKAYLVEVVIDNTHIKLKEAYRCSTDQSGNRVYKTGNRFVWYGHGNPSKEHDFVEYTEKHRGIPEWGIQHATQPGIDGLDWNAEYRTCNAVSWAGIVLAPLIMEEKTSSRKLWNHNVLFDYQDRYMEIEAQDMSALDGVGKANRQMKNSFLEGMWDTFRKDYGCVWTRYDKSDLYSLGYYNCGAGAEEVECSGVNAVTGYSKYPTERAKTYNPCQLAAPENILYGDVNGKDGVTIEDAAMVAKFVVGIGVPGINLSAANVDNEPDVTIKDAALIAKKVVGLIAKFPVEER